MGHSVGPRPGATGSNSPFRPDFDPNKKWRSSSEQLDAAIRCAIDYGYEGVSLDVAVERMQSNKRHPPSYVLTCDDGYVDNLNYALPVCKAYDVPMLTYVTSGFVQRTHTAWWHVLEFLLSEREELTWQWQGERHHLACKTPRDKYASFEKVSSTFTLATPMASKMSMENLRSSYGDAAWQYVANLFLTEAQLLEFSNQPGGQLGVHTVSHGALAVVDAETVAEEFDLCQRYLEKVTGSPTRYLAYPFGTPETVSTSVFQVAQQQGYLTAVTTQHGVVFGKRPMPMAIPRVILAPSDNLGSLRCKLSGVTTWIKRCTARAPAYAN